MNGALELGESAPGEEAVLRLERNDVGDGAEGDDVEMLLQVEVRDGPGPEEGVGDLEDDARGAEVMVIVPEFRIDEGDARGHALRRRFVVVEDDEVDAPFTEDPRLLARVRPAIGRDEKPGRMALETVLDALHAEPVTLLEPGREKGARLEPVGREDGGEEGEGTDPVNVVVAVEHDRFAPVDGLENAANRGLDAGQGMGIAEVLEPGMEELLEVLAVRVAPLQGERDDDGRKTEVTREFADKFGIGRWRDHPSGLRGHPGTLERSPDL